MKIPIFRVDAFTGELFRGNPAAVCLLQSWLPGDLLQAIAAENNLSETAYLVPQGEGFALRWFTPTTEVKLCGHATLASAFVVCTQLQPGREQVVFSTQSGDLAVQRKDDRYEMDFPALQPAPCEAPPALIEALGEQPEEVWAARDYMAVFQTEAEVRGLVPDMALLELLDRFAVIATAPGDEVDFVSRFFAPARGVPEDPVTGSAHCTLTPYWSDRLGKVALRARQISSRGGELWCEDRGDRILMAGEAVLYGDGSIYLPETGAV